jgi:hypothetical protein
LVDKNQSKTGMTPVALMQPYALVGYHHGSNLEQSQPYAADLHSPLTI